MRTSAEQYLIGVKLFNAAGGNRDRGRNRGECERDNLREV